jgi:hypothetical protein
MDIKTIKMNINTKIYLVTNCYGNPNWVYIGKTVNSRKNAHKKTYGDQIEYTYIDEVNSLFHNDWESLETYWIEQFKAWGFEIMNIRKKGGSGPSFQTSEVKLNIGKGNLGKKKPGVSKALKGGKSWHKPDTGDKISKSKQGMKLTEEWKHKISESTKGNTNRLGDKQSSETKDKISKALKGKKRTEETIQKMKKPRPDSSNFGKHRKGVKASEETLKKQKQSKHHLLKPVIQYNKQGNIIGEFDGVREASRQTGCYDSAITLCCQGKLKTTKGFIFKYKNQNNAKSQTVNT